MKLVIEDEFPTTVADRAAVLAAALHSSPDEFSRVWQNMTPHQRAGILAWIVELQLFWQGEDPHG